MIRKKGHLKTTLVFPCSTTSRQSFSLFSPSRPCTCTTSSMYNYHQLYFSALLLTDSETRLAGPTLESFTQTEPFDANVSQQFNVCLATEEKGQNMGSSHRGMKCDYLGSRLVYWLFLQNEDDFERKGISMYQTQ